jgi:hypothetical protein
MFFNLLTLSVPDVTPGCYSIFWLWAYLTVLQDIFQSFVFERTWRYSRMFFNLLTFSVPDVTPGCFSRRASSHVCIMILLLAKQMFLRIYHITSVFQMKLAIVLLILGLISATLCCGGWNKGKPCFCKCEDAKADCIKRTVPDLDIPLDDLIGKVRTNFCDMHMLTCMKNCIYWI